ncbi:MAG: PepSY domain-containing protein [Candidatus Sulfotelmatobacter sp.]
MRVLHTNVRRLILNAHLFVALTAGAFMVILGLTGSIMEFEPELDHSLHPHLSYITPGRQVLSLSEIGDAASRRFGGEPVVAYLPSSSADLSSQVILPSGIAYVNQYTGEVLGERVRGETFFGYVRELHVRLATGNFGTGIVKWSAIAMIFSLASGFYLWWPMKQVCIRTKWGGRRLWFDLHNAIGIFTLLPLAMLAATGTILGFEDQLAPVIYGLTGSQPTHTTRSPVREAAPGAMSITPDEAVAIARASMPGTVPYRVQMPNYGGVYEIALLDPHDSVAGDRNVVALDPYRGSILSVTRSSHLSRGERFLAMNEAIHTGSVMGMASRITVWLASTAVFVQALSGMMMWLYRKKILLAARGSTNQESVS